MRGWIVAVVLLAACKGNNPTKIAHRTSLASPKVSVATVVAKEPPKPPMLLIVDAGEATDSARLAAAATWADLDAAHVVMAQSPVEDLDKTISNALSFRIPPIEVVKALNKDGQQGLDKLEDVMADRTLRETADDPPSPGIVPNDDDRRGGTGTKVQRPKSSGLRATYLIPADRPEQHSLRNDGGASRVADVEGCVLPDGRFEQIRLMIVIDPTAKATKLIRVIETTGGAIAVSQGGKLRLLNLDFDARDPEDIYPDYVVEARVSAQSVVVEAVPDKSIETTKLEDLAAAVTKAREARGAHGDNLVDVLVDPDIDVQRMLDVLVALEVAGVPTIGLGSMPSTEEMARRGHRIPTMTVGVPFTEGNLDKEEVRKVFKANLAKIKACYEKALVTNPDLIGTVQLAFSITPKGAVTNANASGVDPAVEECIDAEVEKLVFPKPAGGSVQVNYPFTMRP